MKKYFIPIIILATALLVVYIVLADSAFIKVSMLLLYALFLAFFVSPEISIIAFISVRPLLDTFNTYTVVSYQNFSLNLNAILGLAIFLFGIVLIIYRKMSLKIPGITILPFFLFFGVISVFVSEHPIISLEEILKILGIFILYIIAYNWAKNAQLTKNIKYAILVSSSVPILVSFWQLFTQSGLNYGLLNNRVFGTFVHPNILGFFLVIIIALLLSEYLISKNKKILYLFIPVLIPFIFTYTRGAWLGLAVLLCVLGAMIYRKQLIIALAVIILLFLSLQAAQFIAVNQFDYDLKDIPLYARLMTRGEEDDSIAWRLKVWNEMSPLIWQAPLTGHGLGMYPYLRSNQTIDIYEATEAHNDYLRLAIEVGLLGTAAYVLLWMTILRKNLRTFFATKSRKEKIRPAIACGLIISFLIMSFADNILEATAVMWVFWTVLGLFSFSLSKKPLPKDAE